jgi:hypothetical protein
MAGRYQDNAVSYQPEARKAAGIAADTRDGWRLSAYNGFLCVPLNEGIVSVTLRDSATFRMFNGTVASNVTFFSGCDPCNCFHFAIGRFPKPFLGRSLRERGIARCPHLQR